MLPSEILEEARRLHDGTARGYHAWSHPQALLKLFDTLRNRLHDPLAVECAIVFHDAIYDPTRTDNERQSADLAARLLREVVPPQTRSRAIRLIEATERHLVPEGLNDKDADDCRIFLDLDLSILGAGDEAFDAYEAGVRHEYQHVPVDAFRLGRAAILERFLARDRLYITEWGHEMFEAQARVNLARSLDALRSGLSGPPDRGVGA